MMKFLWERMLYLVEVHIHVWISAKRQCHDYISWIWWIQIRVCNLWIRDNMSENIRMFVSDFHMVGGSLDTPQRYNWNIAESGVKHQFKKKSYIIFDYLILVYFMESYIIHCHDMKDPTQLYNFNYFINTKRKSYTTMYNLLQSMNKLIFFKRKSMRYWHQFKNKSVKYSPFYLTI
jgi:hypothetical protein